MKLTLLTGTADIQRTLDIIWQVSKTDMKIDYSGQQFSPTLLQELINENVPVLRHFYFTFLIEDMPIAFREQLVRTQYDHYWIQSGRVTNWTTTKYETRQYDDPVLIEAQRLAINAIDDFVQKAHHRGTPPEEYRHLIPVGAYHRGIWTANLESLITRFKKRSCWVAQWGYWLDVLYQAKAQIEERCGITIPIHPPCKDKKWNHTGCTVAGVMEDRAVGSDPLPCCPIYLDKEGHHIDWGDKWDEVPSPERQLRYDVLKSHKTTVKKFETMWGRDVTSS